MLNFANKVVLLAGASGCLLPLWSLAQGRPAPVAASAGVPAAPVVNLLDDQLSAWYKWLGVPYYTMTGLPAGTPTGDGRHGTPLGRHDPKNVFTVETLVGEPVLHISGEIYGGLTTNREYGDYHLRLQYKWGTKKWLPRGPKPRDSGLVLQTTGRNEDAYWEVFMPGLECQISERTAGDLLFMYNKDSTLAPVATVRMGTDNQWVDTQPYKQVGGRGKNPKFFRSANFESDSTHWTTMDVYLLGSSGVYLVNEHVVMAFEHAGLQHADGQVVPLTRGKIQIQSEGAEIFYKNISIQAITEIPAALRQAAHLAAGAGGP